MNNARRGHRRTAPAISQTAASLTTEEQKSLILNILDDFASDPDVDALFGYLQHCGIPLRALRSAADIVPAFLGHYRIRPGLYDVDRACEDLRWWPPVVARLAELQAEAEARAAAHRQEVAEPGILPHDL